MQHESFYEAIFKVNWSQVPLEVMEGITSGRLNWPENDGVVRDAAGRIVNHLPLVRVDKVGMPDPEQLTQLANAIRASQASAVTAAAVSTVIVVAVVAAATAHLSIKIDGVSAAVHRVYAAVDHQSRRELLSRVSEYAAAVKVGRGLLTSKATASEIGDQLSLSINRLHHLREETLHFVQGLPSAMEALDESSQAQFEQALVFIVSILDWIPMALRIEEQLCSLAGKPTLATYVMTEGVAGFWTTMDQFRKWCDMQYELVIRGRSEFGDALLARRQELRRFFNSPIHAMLLDTPAANPSCRSDPDSGHEAPTTTGGGHAGESR